MKTIVVLTGAGISAESGLHTFRDQGGLWHNYRIEDVATPEAWQQDPARVLAFYNERRKQLIEAKPNNAHLALAALEKKYVVRIITQNIDDLHERGGSTHILHLHGELRKARSTADPDLVYDISGWELNMGDLCEKGSQLRPHVVWFGEAVPLIEDASEIVSSADLLMIIGTSMVVYPAAGLVNYARYGIPIYYIDPQPSPIRWLKNVTVIPRKAGDGVPALVKELLENKEQCNEPE